MTKPHFEVRQIADRHRVMDAVTGKPAINSRTGRPIDGGGHREPNKAARQVRHIEASLGKKRRE